MTTKGIGQREMDKVRPACGLFLPSSFRQALFATSRGDFLLFPDDCPPTAIHFPVILLHVNQLFSNPPN